MSVYLKQVEAILGPQEEWPTFTKAQYEFLAKIYAPRCIKREESLEEHLRFAGACELVEIIRQQTREEVLRRDGLTADEVEIMITNTGE